MSLDSTAQRIERPSNYYTYKDQIVRRKEIGRLIKDTNDSESIKHYRRFQQRYVTGLVVFGAGAVLVVGGLSSSIEETTPSPIFLAGLATSGVGITLLVMSGKSLEKAVNRFNVFNEERLRVQLGGNGLGLAYRF